MHKLYSGHSKLYSNQVLHALKQKNLEQGLLKERSLEFSKYLISSKWCESMGSALFDKLIIKQFEPKQI